MVSRRCRPFGIGRRNGLVRIDVGATQTLVGGAAGPVTRPRISRASCAVTGRQIRFMAAPPPIQSLNLNLVSGLSLAMELTRFDRPASPYDVEADLSGMFKACEFLSPRE
jgi:hypothetical protein